MQRPAAPSHKFRRKAPPTTLCPLFLSYFKPWQNTEHIMSAAPALTTNTIQGNKAQKPDTYPSSVRFLLNFQQRQNSEQIITTLNLSIRILARHNSGKGRFSQNPVKIGFHRTVAFPRLSHRIMHNNRLKALSFRMFLPQLPSQIRHKIIFII